MEARLPLRGMVNMSAGTVRPRPRRRVTLDPLTACRLGQCEHSHWSPPPPSAERRAEIRVRDALRELREAVRCLPDGHLLRHQYEQGAYAPWRLRAHALMFEIDRDQASWARLSRSLRGPS